MRFILLSCLCVVLSGSLNGQDYKDAMMFSLEDAYPLFPVDTSFILASIDSLSEGISDSIPEKGLYVYGDWETKEWGVIWYLVTTVEEGFKFLSLDYEDAFDHLQFYRDSSAVTDVNGDGVDEVFIHFESYLGHTGWENAIHERWGGLMIIDLENNRKLLEMDTYYKAERWWTVFEEDTTETLSYEEREVIDEGGEYECDFFTVEIGLNTLRVQYNLKECINEHYDHDPTVELNQDDIPVYTYQLTKQGFILKDE